MRLRAEHDSWLKDRQIRRAALAETVQAKVLAEYPGNPGLDGHLRGLIQEARRAALADFDSAEPEAGYFEWLERAAAR